MKGDIKMTASRILPNMTRLTSASFSAVSADQWYAKNPQLFATEIKLMQEHFPSATYGFLRDGTMIWRVKMDINPKGSRARPFDPWEMLIVYDKDHPHNLTYGGSIHLVPLSPSYDKLRRRAIKAGYRGVPHMIAGLKVDGKEYNYLCTRIPKDVEDGREHACSAAKAMTWAADWALHYELCMRGDKALWNQWVDDYHFSDWKVAI